MAHIDASRPVVAHAPVTRPQNHSELYAKLLREASRTFVSYTSPNMVGPLINHKTGEYLETAPTTD